MRNEFFNSLKNYLNSMISIYFLHILFHNRHFAVTTP